MTDTRYMIEEIIAVNDIYHTLLWEQRQGRDVSGVMISDRVWAMLAAEKMDRTSMSIHWKLSQIEGFRKSQGLDGLENIEGVDNLEGLDLEELKSLIGSYEYLFKCMEQESAGIKCHGRERAS